MSDFQIIKHKEYPTIHTPFVMDDGENTVIFCGVGQDGSMMDVWVLSNTRPPECIIRCRDYMAAGICGPWVVREGSGVALYAAVQYYTGSEYRITKFTAPSVYGPYTLADANAARLDDDDSANGPCIVDNFMYYVEGHHDVTKYDMTTGMRDLEFIPPAPYITLRRFKPNVFKVGEEQLVMFLTEIDNFARYRTAVLEKAGPYAPWRRVAELKNPPFGASKTFSYKPFLYKGWLVRVGKDTPHMSQERAPVEHSQLEVHRAQLSKVWDGFTDYPAIPEFPIMDGVDTTLI